MPYKYIIEYYLAIQNEILPFARTWEDIEGSTLKCEIYKTKQNLKRLTDTKNKMRGVTGKVVGGWANN